MLTIETYSFSKVIEAFIEHYPSSVIKINNKIITDDVSSWCTDKNLNSVIEFSLTHMGRVLLGFNDGPENMWASDEALPLIKSLEEQNILSFTQTERAQIISPDDIAVPKGRVAVAIQNLIFLSFSLAVVSRFVGYPQMIMALLFGGLFFGPSLVIFFSRMSRAGVKSLSIIATALFVLWAFQMIGLGNKMNSSQVLKIFEIGFFCCFMMLFLKHLAVEIYLAGGIDNETAYFIFALGFLGPPIFFLIA